RGSQPIVVSRKPDSTPVSEDVVAFYSELYNPGSLQVPLRPQRPHPKSSDPPTDLLKAFHLDAVQKAIRDYPVARSAGPDGIHPILYKRLANAGLAQLLAHLFELCVRSGVTPTRWNTSLVHPIPKGGVTVQASEEAGVRANTFQTIDQLRPISLTAVVRRLFEKCFLAGLSTEEKAFHPGQAGFRSGFSTVSHALVAHTDAARGDCFQAFVDLKQAYDRTLMPVLFAKLERRGFSREKLALLYSLSIGTRSYVNINGTLSLSAFERMRGLFQGSLLAPFLFNVYIDDVPDAVQLPTSTPDGTDTLLYADDIKMKASSRAELREMIRRLQAWCS
ncbi:hypothetical protein A4X13_0g9677, partial [Tilletia indica]